MIKNDFDINKAENYGYNGLSYLLLYFKYKKSRYIISKGIDINSLNN